MDANGIDQVRRLYVRLLQETHEVAERVRARLARLRQQFPDLPPEILEALAVRMDAPHGEDGLTGSPHGGTNPL